MDGKFNGMGILHGILPLKYRKIRNVESITSDLEIGRLINEKKRVKHVWLDVIKTLKRLNPHGLNC
jgi:hypothetical protein